MPVVQFDDSTALALKESLVPWDGVLIKATTIYSKHIGPVVIRLPLVEVLAKIKEGEEKCQHLK
jgi:hypothetical protein